MKDTFKLVLLSPVVFMILMLTLFMAVFKLLGLSAVSWFTVFSPIIALVIFVILISILLVIVFSLIN